MASKDLFVVPTRYKNWSYGLTAIGILALVVGFLMYGTGDEQERTRFWAALLQNSTYFLLTANASMFFITATILAHGGWQMVMRRVPEAIAAAVPVIGVITLVILLAIVFGGHHMTHIYHWTDTEAVQGDAVLKGKKPFLNIPFFTIWTILTIGLWSVLGFKVRKISREADNGPMTVEQGKSYIWRNTVWAALYIVWFALTVMSTTPWLWLMSMNAHWYSTMYSWFTFASTWESGLALIILFVVYLKNTGYLEYTNREHVHDLAKFLFAFCIFWAYLWFSQYMLIWYANIPEETIYFKPRTEGAYSGIFWFSFLINFLAPLLIFMRRGSKRNYATTTIMSLIIVFGQWLNFHQMVFGTVSADKVVMNLFDFGIALGFVGVIMIVAGRAMSKYPLVGKYHPYLKESIIHHT
jgi:hypothetical protein